MDISSTRSLSSSTLCKRARYFCFKLDIHCELKSPAHSDSRARFPFIALGYKSSSGSIYRVTRARFYLSLESDVIELGELQIFRGGEGARNLRMSLHKCVLIHFFFLWSGFFSVFQASSKIKRQFLLLLLF